MNRLQHVSRRGWLPLAVAGTLLVAPWSVAVLAQVPPAAEVEVPPQQETAPLRVEETKLDQFADAFVQVEQIQRTALQRLERETDEQKVAAVKAKAESDAVAAVEKTGLPLVEFNQIAQQMMSDIALREKVAERVAQRRPAAAAPPAS